MSSLTGQNASAIHELSQRHFTHYQGIIRVKYSVVRVCRSKECGKINIKSLNQISHRRKVNFFGSLKEKRELFTDVKRGCAPNAVDPLIIPMTNCPIYIENRSKHSGTINRLPITEVKLWNRLARVKFMLIAPLVGWLFTLPGEWERAMALCELSEVEEEKREEARGRLYPPSLGNRRWCLRRDKWN